MHNILITGTAPRAGDYLKDLQAKGLNANHSPALKVQLLNTAMPNRQFDAMVITSPHAVTDNLPNIPVIAVGTYTAKSLTDKGYNVIHTGDGGINDLDLSAYKSILYPCVSQPTLIPNNCIPWTVYETIDNPDFTITHDDKIICVFSARAADMIVRFDLGDKIVLCLSDKIAAKFKSVQTSKFAVSDHPRYDSMISLIFSIRRHIHDTYRRFNRRRYID